MIGTRSLLSAVAATVVVGAGLGAGAPRPEIEIGARRLVTDRAERADEALAQLEASLAPAVDAARAGAARVVAGDETPGAILHEAADLIAAAEGTAGDARRAVGALEEARRAWRPEGDPLGQATDAGELGSIAAQLEASAEAADEFAAIRQRALAVTGTLRAALVALDAGDVAGARPLVAEAREDHRAVVSWEVDLVTLPVWIATSDEMIGAVERIVNATQRGDEAAAVQAANDFAALADDGATADRALRIAIGEGGSAVTAAPLGRLASVLSAIGELRLTVASVRAATGS